MDCIVQTIACTFETRAHIGGTMKYTEQEIEMLARFWLAAHANDWECESKAQIEQARADVARLLDAVTNNHFKQNVVYSAARLMREAREQGAASAAIDSDRLAWLEKWYPGQEEQNRLLHQSIAAQKIKHAVSLKEAYARGAKDMRELAAKRVELMCLPEPQYTANDLRALTLPVPQ
jgi:hypothetical protein